MKIKVANKKGYQEAEPYDGIDIQFPYKNTRRGRVQKGGSSTLQCLDGCGQGVLMKDYRIRKITPKEAWRLMTFNDSDFAKAQSVNSDTQLYKQAGNSIVKNVLMAVFKQML